MVLSILNTTRLALAEHQCYYRCMNAIDDRSHASPRAPYEFRPRSAGGRFWPALAAHRDFGPAPQLRSGRFWPISRPRPDRTAEAAMPRVTFVLHPCHDQVPFVPQSCSVCAPVPPPSQLRNRTKQNIMEHIFQQSTDLPPAQLRFRKCNQRADAVSMAPNSPTGPVTHG